MLETEQILRPLGIYQQAFDNALFLTADSSGMVKVLLNKSADLVLNWYATALWPENRAHMDALPLDAKIAPPEKLILGMLIFSSYPEIAQHFMELAASEQGKKIFARYGFAKK